MQTISLKLPDDLLAQLESEAKARRVTKSWLIRESLEKAQAFVNSDAFKKLAPQRDKAVKTIRSFAVEARLAKARF